MDFKPQVFFYLLLQYAFTKSGVFILRKGNSRFILASVQGGGGILAPLPTWRGYNQLCAISYPRKRSWLENYTEKYYIIYKQEKKKNSQ